MNTTHYVSYSRTHTKTHTCTHIFQASTNMHTFSPPQRFPSSHTCAHMSHTTIGSNDGWAVVSSRQIMGNRLKSSPGSCFSICGKWCTHVLNTLPHILSTLKRQGNTAEKKYAGAQGSMQDTGRIGEFKHAVIARGTFPCYAF